MANPQHNAPTVVSFVKFFETERDIFVQNTSDMQISLSFKGPSGEDQSFTIKRGADPVNLTQFVPFAAIAASTDFRKMANHPKRPMRIMTEEEFTKYFEMKYGQRAQDAMNAAADAHHRAQSKTPDPNLPPLQRPDVSVHAEGTAYVSPQELKMVDADVIHPRVMHACQQVNVDLPDSQKWTARQVIDELEILANANLLQDDDLEYIRARGYWKSVKTWAAQQQLARAEAMTGDGLGVRFHAD